MKKGGVSIKVKSKIAPGEIPPNFWLMESIFYITSILPDKRSNNEKDLQLKVAFLQLERQIDRRHPVSIFGQKMLRPIILNIALSCLKRFSS